SRVIRDYPGFPRGVSGAELTGRIYEQAATLGATFLLTARAVGLSSSAEEPQLTLGDGRTISAHSVVIATGVTPRRLGIASLEAVKLRHRVSGTMEAARTRALFVMMGADPNTVWLKASLQRDDDGYLVTGLGLQTSLPRVFAAGDVRRGAERRVAAAIHEGCLASRLARQSLSEPVAIEVAAAVSAGP